MKNQKPLVISFLFYFRFFFKQKTLTFFRFSCVPQLEYIAISFVRRNTLFFFNRSTYWFSIEQKTMPILPSPNYPTLPSKSNITNEKKHIFPDPTFKKYLTHNKQPNRSRQKMIYCVTIYSPLLLFLPRFYTRPKAPPLSTSARFISFHFISSNFISFLRASFFGVDIALIFISFGHLPPPTA